ncbi:MAG TPA: hypothetical protein VM695_06215 [Phycisphaerae bacterium]|jgi:hypothetical protein|nr:hypothetical protein [Phycisphaerae bacterium]
MNIDNLIEKVPERWRPVAAKYGPALLEMTADEFLRWVELLLSGKTQEAWAVVMERTGDADLLAAGESLNDKWLDANRAEAAKLALQREACMAVLKVLLAVALAGVGL